MQIELNYPDPVPLELDAIKTLLLIVDMENEDAHPSGKRFGGEAVTSIIPNIAALRRKVRQADPWVTLNRYANRRRWNLPCLITSCEKSKGRGALNSLKS